MDLQKLGTSVLVACAIVSTAFVVRGSTTTERGPSSAPSIERRWQEFAREGTRMDSAEGSVTIVEFSDFQCVFCRKFALVADSLRRQGASISVVYRHAVGPARPESRAAAVAFECAVLQGRGREMHDALFARNEMVARGEWWSIASGAGVADSTQFVECTTGASVNKRLSEDSIAAERLGVRGTPTLLVHDLRLNGAPSFDSLLSYVKRARPEAVSSVRLSKVQSP